MEELQDPRLAERTRNGESRSTRGCGARPGSSAAVRMGDYTEIFGGVDSSCSIPVLVLPETMDCYGEELDGSQTLNYSEIFGGFDTGKFTLSYEELVSREKGLTEEDNDRFQEETSIGHVETGASMLHTEDPVEYHIAFTRVNRVASTVHSNLMEAKSNIPQYNYGLNFEAETVSSTGYMEDQSSNHVESDDLILFRRMKDDEERRKKTENKCFIGVIEDDSDNDDSSYHSTSSGDTPFSDYAFLTISDINLHTEPLHVPPPSRDPPVLDMKQEESTLEAALDKGQIPEIYRSFHSHCVGGSRTRHTLKEAVKANSFVEVDASSAAAASAAAMIEAMEQAQASLKSAKELMERKRDGSHDFSSVNGHRSNLVGKSKHKTKMSQCVKNSAFSVDTEEEMQKNGSIFIPSRDKNEKSHEWMIDRQFSELVGNDKLMGNRVISNEMYNSNEAVRLVQHPSTNQFFPGKEVFGKERTILFQGDSGNEVKMLNRHALSEKTLDIIDTSAMPYFQGDVEAKQKVDPALQDCTVSLIQPHKNDNGLKKCEKNHAQNGDKYIENDNKIHNAGERNDTGFMDFYCDRKLDEFNGDKPIWKTLGQGMEYDKPNETSKVSEYDELSTYERMKHSRNVYHSTITCEPTLNKKFDAKLSNLFNSDEVFEKKLEDLSEEFEVNESFIEAQKLLKASVGSERNGAVCDPPKKFELHADKPTVDGEQMKVENNLLGKVQAALELENKIKGLNVNQQVFDGDKVQEVDKNAKFLSSCVEAPSNSMKRMEKIIPDDWTDIGYSRKIEERVREREKDRIFVQKTCESCAKDFVEAREKPERTAVERVVVGSRYKPINDIAEMPSVEVFEKHEKVANEAKLRAERAAVERATAEARERAIERALAEQASIEAKRQGNALNNFNIDIKPNSNNHGAPIHLKSQTVGREIESPLRCKARQERNQRIVERTAKALAEKNMRDLLAQREQVERNRIAESLDAEVRRWSNGKDGNLRALLSTLHYILGNDSGWQPIPLTEVLTAAAVRKAYRKATLYVHPDKLQQRGASIHHKYTCEKVFDLLKDAWNKFNSEG